MTVNRDRIRQFHTRFGHATDEQIDVQRFQTRVRNAWDAVPSDSYWLGRIEQSFADINGSTYQPPDGFGMVEREDISRWLARPASLRELIERIQNLLWALEDVGRNNITEIFVGELRRAIELTPGADYRIEWTSAGELSLVPSGVPTLDEELVDATTDWLRNYPDVRKEFRRALQVLFAPGKRKLPPSPGRPAIRSRGVAEDPN